MNTNNNESAFGEVIYSYSRAQAIADGVQIDVSTVAAEAGIRFPVFLTRAVFDAYPHRCRPAAGRRGNRRIAE